MKWATPLLAFLLPGFVALACQQSPARVDASVPPAVEQAAHRKTGFIGAAPQTDSFSYLTGTSGTVVVPFGNYVTSISAAGGGTIQITPASPYTLPPCVDAGPYDAGCGADASCDAAAPADASGACITPPSSVITIPDGGAYTVAVPVLRGAGNELADGTMITFTGTATYVVTLNLYN